MNNDKAPAFLKIQARALEARRMYQESQSSYINTLVYGHFGTGKSTLFSTMPTPVWIDSFDPGGTKTRALQPLIASGDIIVDNRWEQDSWKNPTVFRAWEKEMDMRAKEGFFEHIGTYGLDSISKWSDYLMYELLKRGTKNKDGVATPRPGEQPQLQDYLIQQMTAVDWLSRIMGYPCHVLVTGHIGLEKDEVSGKIESGLLLYGKLAQKVPLVFDEKYVSIVEKNEFKLLVHNNGIYSAETRIGGDAWETKEDPNMIDLWKKAGLPESVYANRPSLVS